MENKIIINTISENELNGIKDFIKVQLDEQVLPYIYEKKLILLDRANPIYQEYLDINSNIDILFKIYNEVSLNNEQKKEKINGVLKDLYSRTKNLIIEVYSKEQDNEKKTESKTDRTR